MSAGNALMKRSQFPQPRVSDSHFFIAIARGGRKREYALRPGLTYFLLGVLPLLGLRYLGVTFYLVFRDDMLASLMRRQAQMQFAYEDRIAALRTQVDRVSSRQLLDQNSFEGKFAELLVRQPKLEPARPWSPRWRKAPAWLARASGRFPRRSG